MCGIFGLSKNTVLKNDYDNVLHDVEKFVKLSEKRGSDTFGVSFKLKNLNIIWIKASALQYLQKLYMDLLETPILIRLLQKYLY